MLWVLGVTIECLTAQICMDGAYFAGEVIGEREGAVIDNAVCGGAILCDDDRGLHVVFLCVIDTGSSRLFIIWGCFGECKYIFRIFLV